MTGFNIVHFEHGVGKYSPSPCYGIENARRVREYHRSFPEYAETPLRSLPCLAEKLGLGGVYIKDESFRFGLNAFKVLGGSYAIGHILGEKLGIAPEELCFEKLMAKRAGDLTFVTATDGNHGRGVAWTAARLGYKSVVYMPKGTAAERLENIKKLGSEAEITELVYDDAVRLARSMAEERGWILVQDTAWEGYEAIPSLIMQGYGTMALEAYEQLCGIRPTHIFLQAGVGSMAAAVAAFFADVYSGSEQPVITVVEPDRADCFYQTAKANDGALHCVDGDMDTIMAGLACGEPCTLAWDILQNCADNFVTITDAAAAKGMRLLGLPTGNDPKVISGESGASTLGFVAELMQNGALRRLRETIGLDNNSRILCFSTEGDTDRENYRKILQA